MTLRYGDFIMVVGRLGYRGERERGGNFRLRERKV